MAKELQTRPSELLAIDSPLTAYYFDKAMFLFGSQIDEELEKAGVDAKTDKARAMKQQIVMNRWLRSEGGARYKDPAAPRG